MANRHRGEIDAELDGKPHMLCLTLGALAELEDAYGGADLLQIVNRFEKGTIAASDAIKVIGAGLRGAGHAVTDKDVAAMTCAGGVTGMIGIVARLLNATFAP